MRRSVARAAAGHPSGSTRRPPFVDVLLVVMVLLLTAYTVGLALGDHEAFDPLVDGWLCIFTELAAVALCISACVRSRLAEPQVVLGTLAVGTYAAGDAYYASSLDGADALVAMSLADVAYLAFYPLMLGTLAVVVVRRPKALVWPLLVDSLVGALGAASLMAVILAPVLHLGAQSGSYEVIVAVVYPLLDLLLISAVAGILATRGLDVGPRWPFLIAGLLVFSLADVGYALGMQDYAVGSIVDAGWVAGIVAIAAWVDGAADTRGALHGRSHAVPELAAPLVSTAVALVVLLAGTQMSIPALAVVFAGATLALAALPLTSRNRMLITLARTDELTGLPNRRAFLTDVPARLSRETTGALFLLDLDRFKHVNDALGHDVGDELLVHVGERFARHIRPNDMLARLGGDEFAVFLAGVSEDQAVAAAQRLAEELADPVEVASATLLVSASVGIALVPAHGTDMGLLMRKADIAMFRAKAEHRGHHVYDASDDNDGALRLRTIQELRTALAEDQFEMHYQPKVRLVDQEVTGVEALVRWNHPTRGQLPPAAFLALAEEAGLMPELSSLVLRRAIRRAARWRSEGLDISVAVNMSGSCILSCLPYEIHQLLRTHSLPPSRLVLEITEDVLMSTPVGTARILEDLRVSGIRISIDDFGTGYSSLAYLRDLPVDELKLDRSFITAMPHDVRARGLVGSIIDLAHSLGLEVVAEGVNDEGTRDDLLAQGCDSAQGFLFSRPLPAREISSWVSGRVGLGGGSCR